MSENKKDIADDYEYARSMYYNLTEKGQEAIDLMLDLARESEHPRAFEVLSNALKQNAEVVDKLMKLQKEKKDIENEPATALPNSMTQNNVFVGSSTDLQKMLLAKAKEKETIIDADPD